MRRMAIASQEVNFGLIGFGRIGRRVFERLATDATGPKLTAVLVRPDQRQRAEASVGPDRVCTSLEGFIARRSHVVVECASQEALNAYAGPVLAAGSDLIPLSLSAFADRNVEASLTAAATAGFGRLEIPAGAIGSLDVLAAAREDELIGVVFRAAFPVARWRGTAAEAMTRLDDVTNRMTFFRGTVRDIARLFPRHLNVSVGVALAGLGLDRTAAELIADPELKQAQFEIDISAGPGPVSIRVDGRDVALGADPVDYTTFSVLRLLRRRQARVMI